MSKEKLLATRNAMKRKKPEFERTDANIFNQFRGTWRRPKGLHNKMREHFKGHKGPPSIGYSSPTEVKGLTRKGFVPVLVSNVGDLQNIKAGCIAVIASSVGMKKRITILTKAKENKLTVSGVKDIDAYLGKVNEKLTSSKKVSTEKKEEKKKKIEEAAKVKTEEKKDESKK